MEETDSITSLDKMEETDSITSLDKRLRQIRSKKTQAPICRGTRHKHNASTYMLSALQSIRGTEKTDGTKANSGAQLLTYFIKGFDLMLPDVWRTNPVA